MSDATLAARAVSSNEAYQYDTFTTRLILSDLAFSRRDPAAGDRVPDFDIEIVGGGRFASATLGDRPVLLVFGSLTCPVTESSGPVLRDLHASFGKNVRFVMVNTREAHPGQLLPQPKTQEDKRRRARMLKARHGFPFEVAVDGIDGALHRAMGPKPNSAYLLAPDGTILFRGHWANDRAALGAALEAVTAGRRPRSGHSTAMVLPLMKAIGHLPGVVRAGGSKVARDVWRAAAPFGVMAALSRPFAFLPKDYRGLAGLVAAGGLVLGAWALVVFGPWS